ncbi:MAG: M16 family metallopeptidase [Opitutales bacterium]
MMKHRSFDSCTLLLLLACVLLSLVGCNISSERAPTQPRPGDVSQAEPSRPWAHRVSDLPADERISFGQLDNGFRYAILPNREPEGRASLRLYVHAGSLMENDDQKGLAHFLEHMAFNGTENFAAGEMVEYFQRLGMAFGADTNAHTSFDETVYKLELPELNQEILDDSFTLLGDYADKMLLETEEIEKERGVILAEKRARDSVEYRTFVSQWKYLFPNSRLPERFPIGEESIIEFASRETFVDFYQTWYTPERMVLVAVGDFDPKLIRGYVERTFGPLEASPDPVASPRLGRIDQPRLGVHFHPEAEAASTEITLLHLAPYPDIPDTFGLRRKQLYEEVANFIVSRRLERLALSADAPFKAGTSYRFSYLNFFKMSGLEMTTQPERWSETVAVAEQELRRALLYGFTEAEIEEARRAILQRYQQAVREAPSRKSRALADAVVRSIGRERVFTDPATELEVAEAAMKDVDPQKALMAYRDLWAFQPVSDPNAPVDYGRSILVTGNLQMGDEPEAVIKAQYVASREVPVAAPEERAAIEFAYTDFGGSNVIVRDRTFEEVGVRQITFANNVHLNLKQTDFEAGVIHVAVRFGGGLLAAPLEKPGLAALTDQIYVRGGLGEHDFSEIRSLLAGRTAGVNFSVDDEAFQLRGATNTEDLLFQLQVLAAYVTDPAFRPEALRLAHQQFDELYPKLERTVEGVIGSELEQFLHGGDPRFGYPPKDEMLQRSLEEAQMWMQPAREEQWLEVSVVGDFEEDALLEAIGKTFAALPKRQAERLPYADARKVHFPNRADERQWTINTEIPRAAAAVYWPTADMSDISLSRRLSILSGVFDERLRVRIREQLGEGYSPYAANRSSDTFTDYGYLVAFNLVDPEQAERMTGMIALIGAQMAADGVTQDELERVRTPLLKQLIEYQRNNNYWLSLVLSDSQYRPERLEWATTLQPEYASVTAQELSEVARRFLRPDKALKVTIVPDPQALEAAALQTETVETAAGGG